MALWFRNLLIFRHDGFELTAIFEDHVKTLWLGGVMPYMPLDDVNALSSCVSLFLDSLT